MNITTLIFSFSYLEKSIMSKIAMALLKIKCQPIQQQEKKIKGVDCWVFKVKSNTPITDEMIAILKEEIPDVIKILKSNPPKKPKISEIIEEKKPLTKPKMYRGHIIKNENEDETINTEEEQTKPKRYRGHLITEIEDTIEVKTKSKRMYRGKEIKD